MNVCIPITEDRGLASPVSAHFGSAPAFLVVDTQTKAHRVLANAHAQHEHGACTPLDLFVAERIDTFVVGGIGPGALARLLSTGAAVYRGVPGPAAGALEALAQGTLPRMSPGEACHAHHSHG